MNHAVVPVPRKLGLHQRMTPVIVQAAMIAGVIIASQSWSFSWPRDSDSELVRLLQRHALLLGVAGVCVIMLGNAMYGLARRVAELERRLEGSGRNEAV